MTPNAKMSSLSTSSEQKPSAFTAVVPPPVASSRSSTPLKGLGGMGGFGVDFEQERDSSGIPVISSRRRHLLKPAGPPYQTDVPAHTSRLIPLEVNPGVAPAGAKVKFLRRWGGFVDRSKAWAFALFDTDKADLKDDRTKYWGRLQSIFDKCHGCELLQCSHVFTFGASALKYEDEEAEEEAIVSLWEREVFARHAVQEAEQKNAIKRILMVLEDEYDFDFAPQLVDLVCLLSLHLTEVQTYAAIRRIMTISSGKFLRMPRKRSSATPRRLLSTSYAQQMSMHLTFLAAVQKLDPALYAAIVGHDAEIKVWFERWLIPVLPMNKVVALLDCLIAGDDVKLLFRACFHALQISRGAVMEAFERDQLGYNLTEVVRQAKIEVAQRPKQALALRLTRRFPKRKVLLSIEASLGTKDFGKMAQKVPLPHVSRDAFHQSSTILTFEAASRLVRCIPVKYRHTCPRMRSVYKSEIGPVGDNSLAALYAACEREKNCSFLMIIAAKVPQAADDLNEKQFLRTARSQSTSFFHPLVNDANYVVFGVFSPSPFVARSAATEIAPNDSTSDDNACVFRLAPHQSFAKWRNQSSVNPIIVCTNRSLMVGKVTQDKIENDGVPQGSDNKVDVPSLEIGPALLLNEKLDTGFSGYSDAFKNEPLCLVADSPVNYEMNPGEKRKHFYFNIFSVEVFALPKV